MPLFHIHRGRLIVDELTFLQNIDWYEWFIIFVAITLVVKFLYKTYVEDIIIKHGWESAKMRQKREDHELLLKTSQGLLALQEKHNEDESKLENSLATFIEEQKKENDKLRDEMRQYTENRISDRKQSLQIQKELKESVNTIVEGQKSRDEQILALMCGSKELLGNTIDERYEKYINLSGIPQNEVDEFDSIYEAYALLNGNHGRETKYAYVKNHLSVIPVKTELVMKHE